MERLSPPEGYESYEGYILEVLPESFWIRVKRLEDSDIPANNIQAEFQNSAVEIEDRDQLSEGSLFDIKLKFEEDRLIIDQFRFKRLPSFTEEEIAEARLWADELSQKLG